jgi:hypothetical protein
LLGPITPVSDVILDRLGIKSLLQRMDRGAAREQQEERKVVSPELVQWQREWRGQVKLKKGKAEAIGLGFARRGPGRE